MNFRYLKRKLAVNWLAEKDTDSLMESARLSTLKSLIYKMGSQFLIDLDFPLHLYIELSRICNYNCPMCMRSTSPSGSHFLDELGKRIIAEAATKGPTSFSLHLFGEPLANPAWGNIVAMIREARPDNTFLLTTNGYFMNEDCCKKLIDLKVNRIFLSIHSLNPETYRKNTGGGDISIILNNVQTFTRIAGPDCKTKLFIRLFYGPNEPPIEEKQLTELRSLGVSFEIRGYHNFAGGKNEWTTFENTSTRWPCFHPWFTLGVAVDGTVTVCCTDASLGLRVGNALNQTIEEIWKSEAVKSIRGEHLNNIFIRYKVCDLCDTWQFHPDIFFKSQYKNS